ncbi:conserved hypothetical protein [Talaromyces stipitatus ATCC 10500]|uniref:Cytochrome P450 n=1 Tax=Talaromyces stipitatus (strain ATCC 10500 / CBS 375.48 / QM 6759 / NRRL 1006) TaxID=441959 RepID=B8LTA3_TALSN|nr:uncharacterized protein TSTA_059750 [Talaromyces stipitatus ATCC 10500]EED22477.1 conserved hypothetical protein [Talaromyces stipitatus ATCC 10500]
MGETAIIPFACIVISSLLIFFARIILRERGQVLAAETTDLKTIYHTPSENRSVIAAEIIHGARNQYTKYESKSVPSEPIQRGFRIQNAFTSDNKSYVEEFVKISRNLINISSDNWEIIVSATQDAVRRWKSDAQGACESRREVELVPMVQSITLNAVLTAFFFLRKKVTTNDVTFKSLSNLAEAINETWIMSKKEDTFIPFEQNDKLRSALIEVLPDGNISDPCENPLNLILPGFETMWRVVLRGFLEVAYKAGKEHPNWREALIGYSEKPTAEQFKRASSPDGAAWKEANFPEPKIIAADVEACHLSTSIWGKTAGKFDPLRWQKLTKEQEEAFLAFGSKPFECPAKPVFGPRLVGVLVGTLLDAFPHHWTLVSAYGDAVEFGTERLSNERMGCYGLYLELIRD